MEFAEVFLKLTGPRGVVEGNCQDEKHKNEIALFDWGWGLRLEDLPSDSQAEADRSATGDTVRISKAVDVASTSMMTLLNSGETCPEAVLVLKQSTEKAVELKLVLKGVRIESYKLKVECSELEVELSEDWILAYDEVKVQYSSPARAGGASSFMLKIPPGAKQQDPVQMESATKPSASTSSSSSAGGLSKDDVTKLIEEHLKKLKLSAK